jgi:hypothetical protein
MISMAPGDGRVRGPWELCSRCWRYGITDKAPPPPPPPPPAPKSPESRRSPAKDDAGDFSKVPEGSKPLRPPRSRH